MRRWVAVLFAAVLAAGIAACSPAGKPASGSSSGGQNWPADPEGIAAYQKPDRQDMLAAGAKQEGTLTWYTALVAGVQDGLVKGFEAKYPYIKVNVVRGSNLDTRVMQEEQARKPQWDVYDPTPPIGEQLIGIKALAPYYSPNAGDYTGQYRRTGPNNLTYWAMVTTECLGFGYNTNLLPESAVPKTYQDLLNPALKGKMAISGASGVNVVGDIIDTQPNGQQLAEQIAKQQNINVQQVSALATLDLVSSGEFAASPSIFETHVMQAQAKGAPVKWVPLEPTNCTDHNETISAKAPHPHAAALWVNFMLGPDGQKIITDLGYGVTRQHTYKQYFPDLNISVDDYAKKVNRNQQFFQQYFISGH